MEGRTKTPYQLVFINWLKKVANDPQRADMSSAVRCGDIDDLFGGQADPPSVLPHLIMIAHGMHFGRPNGQGNDSRGIRG